MEVDDTLKTQMNSFLLSTASQQEIATLDNKVGAFALGSLGATSLLSQLLGCLLIIGIHLKYIPTQCVPGIVLGAGWSQTDRSSDSGYTF